MGTKYDYIVIFIKTYNGHAFTDDISRISMVYYKNYAEFSRSVFYVRQEQDRGSATDKDKKETPLAKTGNSISKIINGETVIVFGQGILLEAFLRKADVSVKYSLLDCKEYISKVMPSLSGKTWRHLADLFRIAESDDVYSECLAIHKFYVSTARLSRGKMMHEVAPDAERCFSGYWDIKADMQPYARLAGFKDKNVVSAGVFKSVCRDTIHSLVVGSGGKAQLYPDDNTDIIIAGNMEFPAAYQARPFHEALLRIRHNQRIRVISELELLSLLYGQVSWVKKVNSYYVPVPAKPTISDVTLKQAKKEKEQDDSIPFPFFKGNSDDENSRGSKKVPKNKNVLPSKILDAIRGTSPK